MLMKPCIPRGEVLTIYGHETAMCQLITDAQLTAVLRVAEGALQRLAEFNDPEATGRAVVCYGASSGNTMQYLANVLRVPITAYNAVVTAGGVPVVPRGQNAPQEVVFRPNQQRAPEIPAPSNVPNAQREDLGPPTAAANVRELRTLNNQEIQIWGQYINSELLKLIQGLRRDNRRCVITEYQIHTHGTLGGMWAGPEQGMPAPATETPTPGTTARVTPTPGTAAPVTPTSTRP